MKNENIPADIKSKSLKEARGEIDVILSKLEKQETNLDESIEDYKRLILLNKHIDQLFKKKFREISEKKIMIKKKLIKNANKVDRIFNQILKKSKKIFVS
jgi:exonuclease VII small subunit